MNYEIGEKLVCIKTIKHPLYSVDTFTKGKVYIIEEIDGKYLYISNEQNAHLSFLGLPHEVFVTLPKWREMQIDSILD